MLFRVASRMEAPLVNWQEAWHLLWPYVRQRVVAQIRAVAFIVAYLVLFQTLALRIPIEDTLVISGGIGLVVLGLALFMEGLVLGLMPLGESIGLKLPGRAALVSILLFALLLGIGATFAEPAIGVLRAAGATVRPWEAPLLYMLLNQKVMELVLAVAAGVGVAVVVGMLRFLYNWSLKPLIYILVSILVIMTIGTYFDENLRHVLGLAWDCGGVTTGPVTVPLVLALGIGVSRVVAGHTEESSASGFGVVTLASLFPIIAVLLLGIFYNSSAPRPMGQDEFMGDSAAQQMIGYDARAVLSKLEAGAPTKDSVGDESAVAMFQHGATAAMQAILPLTIFMIFVFRVLLREKFAHLDEIIIGIVFAVLGMALFNIGIDLGLGRLGKQVGSHVPAAYSTIPLTYKQTTIEDFDLSMVQTAVHADGKREQYFMVKSDDKFSPMPFDPNHWHADSGRYDFIPRYGPIFGQFSMNPVGIAVVLIFAFLMGYGATLAEPALNALGATVEDLTIGTFKKSTLMQTVAVGVGIGIAAGVAKIIWNVPLVWLLAPPYILLLYVTAISSEQFVNIGWDSAGVTTGPITVPLVLAMGLGISQQAGVVEGFGILAMASVSPILCVLLVGLRVTRTRQRLLAEVEIA